VDANRKYAYRFLLYWAMLDIRSIEWLRWTTLRMLNPLSWREQIRRIRRAGALANWLHNLALFSALDFERFDEARFWHDLETVCKRYPEYGLVNYRSFFERIFSEQIQKHATD
jgi:hypothetical protein